MKKVVAFLEQYAEWLALGVAALFFLFVVWGYVINPTAVKIPMAGGQLSPGEVDPRVDAEAISRLRGAMETRADDLHLSVPNFAQQFEVAMGPNRPQMSPEVLAGIQPTRPSGTGSERLDLTPTPGQIQERIAELPKMPKPLPVTAASGNSLVAPPMVAGEQAQPQDPDALPVAPPVAGADTPEAQLANAVEKNWVTVETKLPVNELAEEWKRVFYDKQTRRPKAGLTAQALQTCFMQIEVQREELVGPETWSNQITLKPIEALLPPDPNGAQPGQRVFDFPKAGDREQMERYRMWAEQNQIAVAEPQFYRVLKGDPWYVPSLGAPKDPNQLAAAEGAAAQPFDPANPPTDRQLTSWEKQQVYIYKQKQKQEQQKQEAAARRSATDAARRSAPSGGYNSGGGRRLGGYGSAPLPIELAAGQGVSDRPHPQPVPPSPAPGVPGNRGRAPVPPPNMGRGGPGPVPPTPAPPFRGGGGRPGGAVAPTPPQQPYLPNGVTPGAGYDSAPSPAYDPSSGLSSAGSIMTGPFDPARVPPNAQGKIPEMTVWAHDDTVVPGKTYRYRMRIRMKNPLYNTFNVAKDAKDAERYTIDSDWTDWKEVKAPRTTEFFFATKRQQIGKGVVNAMTVHVFKRQKGEWTMAEFTCAPGDSIGGVKNGVDYSTGMTLVDLRPDVREKDVRILVADDTGTIDRIDYEAQVNDQWYKTLLEKVRGPQQPPPGYGQPAGYPGSPGYRGDSLPGAEGPGI